MGALSTLKRLLMESKPKRAVSFQLKTDLWSVDLGKMERAMTLQFAGIILCIRSFSMVQQSIRFKLIIYDNRI
jgi:hypothetical protein